MIKIYNYRKIVIGTDNEHKMVENALQKDMFFENNKNNMSVNFNSRSGLNVWTEGISKSDVEIFKNAIKTHFLFADLSEETL